jgi:hypothetical protein
MNRRDAENAEEEAVEADITLVIGVFCADLWRLRD